MKSRSTEILFPLYAIFLPGAFIGMLAYGSVVPLISIVVVLGILTRVARGLFDD